ncbi:MAG: hypothetical protein ABIP78_01085 [Pyrinomonadaceae bacterium]
MNKRKHQNSILVIATLGVYLGLVLAGATPLVMANAAMSGQFDVKGEIEVKDDLDTKPDDERSPVSTSVQIYLEDVEYFLATLGRLKTRGKFDPNSDTFDVAQSTLLPCVDSNLAGRYTPIRFNSTSESTHSALEYFSRGMVYGYSLGDCIANNEFDGVAAVDSRFNFELSGKALSINLAIKKQSPQRALELVRELESTIRLYSAHENSKFRQNIIQTTSFRAENDQVFVVTRLPRAGLEPLLAK